MNSRQALRDCLILGSDEGLTRHLEWRLNADPDWRVWRAAVDLPAGQPIEVVVEVTTDEALPTSGIRAGRRLHLVLSTDQKTGEGLPSATRAADGQWTVFLPPLHGKWCQPITSPLARWCQILASGGQVEDPGPELLHSVYIDDVVEAVLDVVRLQSDWVSPTGFRLPRRAWLKRLLAIAHPQDRCEIPDVSDPLMRQLQATYLSWLGPDRWLGTAEGHADARGTLHELLRMAGGGQVFVSTTAPGVTRGNHYHHSKVERFCLLRGAGTIRLRALDSAEVIEIPVRDQPLQWVDIPPGYTHSIENTGREEMLVLFWANERFDPQRPDTYPLPVLESPAEKGPSRPGDGDSGVPS